MLDGNFRGVSREFWPSLHAFPREYYTVNRHGQHSRAAVPTKTRRGRDLRSASLQLSIKGPRIAHNRPGKKNRILTAPGDQSRVEHPFPLNLLESQVHHGLVHRPCHGPRRRDHRCRQPSQRHQASPRHPARNRPAQRLLLLFLDRRTWLHRLQQWTPRLVHVQVEQREQLGRRQGLEARPAQDRWLQRNLEQLQCKLVPLPLRLDHQPPGGVLHRRGVRLVQPLVGRDQVPHSRVGRRHLRRLPHPPRQPALYPRNLDL